ncbi:MAG: TadE/TadG family type IV pilus assembly protein [Paracoccaceae bacterium]
MSFKNIYSAIVGKFIGKQDGAILVEFALVLPLFLLFIAISVEFGRVFWTYQSAIAGVRDASRYLARVAPIDICLNGGTLAGYEPKIKDIVENVLGGASLFPSSITITSVTPSLTCVSGAYRIPEVPIATVSAIMTITWPLGNIFSLFGNGLGTITTTITDQARIFGQ